MMRKASPKSPSLQRKPEAPGIKVEAGVSTTRAGAGGGGLASGSSWLSTGSLPSPVPANSEESSLPLSVDDSDCVDSSALWENGKSETVTSVTHSDEGSLEGQGSDSGDTHKTRAAIEHLKAKIEKTKELIKQEQTHKECNVNEYLHLAASADKQQNQRIKTVFEKRNQKSAHSINHLQKKLEQYRRRLQEIETHGLSGHKQAKEVLRDVGQGLKDVGANIVDGLTGFSGSVVDNMKGARHTIVSKPKEFAHLLKNRFGSADNISEMKIEDTLEDAYPQQAGGTLPVRYASFRMSDDDNSSITSGSGYGALHTIPCSTSQDAPSSLPVATQMVLEPLCEDMSLVKESNQRVEDSLTRLLEEFENYKAITRSEMSFLRGILEEEKFHVERLEEQLNDLTELHQNEMANLKQDISSMEEKIEYRLDDRTSDLSDLVDNCQTRISRIEQQQQQQQLVSMEMVENVKFQTLLTKLINVVLAVLAVILVFLSTAGNLLSPFINSKKRILWTSLATLMISLLWVYFNSLLQILSHLTHSLSTLFFT